MTSTRVSVITPTYNHERFIGPCIESVLAQTLPDWEMIIVDDASTDGTPEIVRRYDDLRITYIRQDHVGPYRMAETYNRALARSQGEYIAILEGDDVWPPYKLATQTRILDRDAEVVASYGRAGLIDAGGQPVGLYPLPRIAGSYARTEDFLLGRAAVQPVTVVLRRAPLLQIAGFTSYPRLAAVDLATWLRLSLAGPFRFDNTVLGLWRTHSGQVTSDPRHFTSSMDLLRTFYLERYTPAKRPAPVTWQEITKTRRASLAIRSWAAAQEAMASQRWPDARRNLRAMVRYGDAFRRLEAVVAYAATFARIDAGVVAAALAKTSLGWRAVRRHNALASYLDPASLVDALESGGECAPFGVPVNSTPEFDHAGGRPEAGRLTGEE